MQTSITSFFKVKSAKESNQTEQPARADSIEDEGSDTWSEDNVRPKQNSKRLIDSDDEDDLEVAKSKKRPVLSSAESTPVKGTPVKSDYKIKTVDQQEVLKSPPTTAKQLFAPSPLLNVQTIINAKISSGSSALHPNIGATWFKALQTEFDKPYFKNLSKFLNEQRSSKTVYPPEDKVFTWTHHHAIRDTRVVVIGQDPYHGPNQAHGLSFSVQKGIPVPKSLQNIFAELKSDLPDYKPPNHGDLTGWAKQGVLMLNSCLTVNAGQANSHQGKGWEKLTDATISWISKNVQHKVVFMLWGRFAQKKASLIDKRHKILTAAHPSPLSAHDGFLGCKHFSQTNTFLKSQKLPEIDWASL